MYIKWMSIFALLLHITSSMNNCPQDCTCDFDELGRLQTICIKGDLRNVPVRQLDVKVEVLIIRGPRNNFNIGPIFAPFQQLKVLRITDSNVPAIGKNTFWGCQNLRILDLSRNNITTITDDNFRGQDGLHELDLSNNKMHRMPSGIFYHLKDLRKLNLADNAIEELVSRLFYMLSKLKHLDLSGNSLNDLPPDVFKDVSELKVLRCRACNLKKINAQVYNLLQHLEELDLGDNQLKYLEKDEFYDLRRLKKIRIDGNQLSVVIDNLFIMQKSLQYLDLSRNRLAKVTNDAFNSLANLTYLDLSYNKLGKLEAASVTPLQNLHALNISGNMQIDLLEIRDTFQTLQHLSSLYVAEMGPLPMTLLDPFNQLKALNLSGNHLDNHTLQIINTVTSLELLDLSRNQLNSIGDALATKLHRIKDVKLENNPLICDRCHLGSLIDVAGSLKWNHIPVCFLPESVRGAAISDLNSRALEYCTEIIHDEGHDAASTSHNFLERGNLNALAFLCGIIFVLVAAIILISVVCYSRHRARYYTHEDKRNESALEKTLDATPAIKGNEIRFTFPLDDRVCTIDEMVLPPPPPPPPLPSKKAHVKE